MAKLEGANARRRAIVQQYHHALEGLDWIERPVEKEYTRSAWHNYVIKTPLRDKLNLYLKEQGIATGVHYMPAHLQPYYRRQSRVTLPVSERVWVKLLTLPLYPDLTDEDVSYIITAIRDFGHEMLGEGR